MVNKAIIVGRVGGAPEIRFTGSGQAVANFSVATSEKYKDKNGAKVEKTEWHRITAWGKLAEIVQTWVKKGMLVFIEGKIETREWTDKEGGKRKSTGIIARELRMLGGGDKDGQSAAPRAAQASNDGPNEYEGSSNDEAPAGGNEITDEDIPF